MAQAMDYNTVHKHLKQLKSQSQNNGNSSSGPSPILLDEKTAITYISGLRLDLINYINSNSISNSNTTKTLNEIIVLTKTLDYVPKSDSLFALFDAQLFRSLLNLACSPTIPVEVLRGILRICLTYLAGVLPKTRKQGMFRILLNVLCEPVDNLEINNNNNIDINIDTNKVNLRCDLLFNALTARITFADSRMNLNIVDFISKILYRLMETINSNSSTDSSVLILEENWLIEIVRSLYISNFFGALACVKGIDEIENMTGLKGSMDLSSKWLMNKLFLNSNKIWLESCSLLNEIGINLSDKDHTNEVNLLTLLSLIGTLNQPRRSLKKILVECNMTSIFPILKILSSIIDNLSSKIIINRIFSFWNTELLYSFLNVATRCWLFSGATIDSDDTDKIVNMIEIVIDWLDEQLNNNIISGSDLNNNTNYNTVDHHNIDFENNNNTMLNTKNENNDFDITSLLEKIDNFDYDEIKSLQLKKIRANTINNWKEDIKSFENLVHSQVISLVRGQRFLQLSKGSWVYATNPLDNSNSENRFYFLTLNSNTNSQSIIYKEFSKKPTKLNQSPNLDKDGIRIDFSNILQIDSENLNPNLQENGLISIQSERMDVNRVDVVMKSGIFTFFVDTKQLRDIWVDGLRILVSDSKTESSQNNNISNSTPMKLSISEEFFTGSGVTDDVKKQVRTLEDISLRTQMLDLDIKNSLDECIENKLCPDLSSLNFNFFYD